jgi:hypothetical protein
MLQLSLLYQLIHLSKLQLLLSLSLTLRVLQFQPLLELQLQVPLLHLCQ